MTAKENVQRLTVRGWKNGVLEFAEAHTFHGEFNERGEDIQTMADRQIAQVATAPLHLIEIEFMDEPDREKRFMRLGPDKERMVEPHPVNFPCEACGADLVGIDGHKPGCAIDKLIHEIATAAREAGLDPRAKKKPSVH